MLKKFLSSVALLCSLAGSGPGMAQDTPVLTYEMAERAMAAAVAEARANNWNLTILVADAAGFP